MNLRNRVAAGILAAATVAPQIGCIENNISSPSGYSSTVEAVQELRTQEQKVDYVMSVIKDHKISYTSKRGNNFINENNEILVDNLYAYTKKATGKDLSNEDKIKEFNKKFASGIYEKIADRNIINKEELDTINFVVEKNGRYYFAEDEIENQLSEIFKEQSPAEKGADR